MKMIGDLLRTYIERSGYTIYGIAKISGVNRSTLQKILLENRKPSKTLMNQLMPFLKLAPEEQSELLTIVEVMNTGESLYDQRLCIKQLLEHISDILCGNHNPVLQEDSGGTPVPLIKGAQFFHGKHAVERLINQLIRHECATETPGIRINLPGNSNLLHDILLHTMYYCPDYQKLRIQHLTCFYKMNCSNKLATENLEILHNIIPFIANTELNYQVHYYYDYNDAHLLTQSTLTALPYYMIGSDWCVLLSSDGSASMFCDSHDMSVYLNSLFDSELLHARLLANTCSDPKRILCMFVESNNSSDRHTALEFQPCFSSYFTEALARKYVRKEIEQFEELVQLVALRSQQISNFSDYTFLFSQEGLQHFAETGYITFFPTEYANPLSLNDRISFLERLCQNMEQGAWRYSMLNPKQFAVAKTFAFYAAESNGLTFIGINGHDGRFHYVTIDERTLIDAFYDFIDYLTQSPYVYSNEVTLDFVRQCIQMLQHKQMAQAE